jgi:capsular exopolysaccharide synthesis family protein
MSGSPEMLDSVPEVLNNDLIRQIKSMEVDLYKRMSELSKKYGEQHPQMIAIESELKTLQKRKAQEITRVIHSLRNEYKVAEAREKSLKAALEKQKRESLDLNQKAIQYTVLSRETESARQMYDLLIKRFKETSLTEDMRTGNIRIIDRAEVPKTAVRPKKMFNILLALLLGLVAGTGLAFFFEYLDNTIKLPEDIQKYLREPYLGPVPAMTLDGNPQGSEKPELVTLHSPKSTASEAYRGIRTSLLFSSADKPPQVVLVSSAAPQEGKTSTALNLAITMAQTGGKVILLDCDMRKPSLHKVFGLPRDKGMSSILVGNCEVKDALLNTPVPNLDIIPCGPIPPNPSEILGSPRMARLLELLRKSYSRVIIDTPPVTAVTDAAVIGRLVDGAVVVVRAGATPREIVRNGLIQLKAVNSPILGVVLNGVDMDRDGSYYYQYYYYYYGEDGSKKKRVHTRKRSKIGYGEEAAR